MMIMVSPIECPVSKRLGSTSEPRGQQKSMASVQNGPVSMYQIKPYHEAQSDLELPTCMYSVKSYHKGNEHSPQSVSFI